MKRISPLDAAVATAAGILLFLAAIRAVTGPAPLDSPAVPPARQQPADHGSEVSGRDAGFSRAMAARKADPKATPDPGEAAFFAAHRDFERLLAEEKKPGRRQTTNVPPAPKAP